mmetsp:Transcript_24136/g.54849  ORF Transcript_24136/g.54849 Transcript_24136/m.54849 type:complete len:264 (+) Transcript_24136:37-828(+)
MHGGTVNSAVRPLSLYGQVASSRQRLPFGHRPPDVSSPCVVLSILVVSASIWPSWRLFSTVGQISWQISWIRRDFLGWHSFSGEVLRQPESLLHLEAEQATARFFLSERFEILHRIFETPREPKQKRRRPPPTPLFLPLLPLSSDKPRRTRSSRRPGEDPPSPRTGPPPPSVRPPPAPSGSTLPDTAGRRAATVLLPPYVPLGAPAAPPPPPARFPPRARNRWNTRSAWPAETTWRVSAPPAESSPVFSAARRRPAPPPVRAG